MKLTLTKPAATAAAAIVMLAVAACSQSDDPTPTTAPAATQPPTQAPREPLSVVASVYPVQYFAERVGGDRVDIVPLVPPGAEAHTFELTASDLITIGEADVVAMNGLELEPWLERALDSLGSDASGIVVEAASTDAAVAYEDHEAEEGEHHGDEDEEAEEGEHHGDEDEEAEEGEHHDDGDDEAEEGEHHGDEDDDHGHGDLDPHFWLDPLRAITQAERIAEALIEADPAGAGAYRANLAVLSSELRALHAEFETGLSSCAHRDFITSHAAYGYLALAYNLEQVSVSGLSPDAEPSPQRLAQIADRINDLGLGAVLVEPVLAGAHEQVLADETGADVYEIHAIGSVTQDELAEHGDYFGLMRDNLSSLRSAMECS